MISMMEKLEEIDLAEKAYQFDEGMKKGMKEGQSKGMKIGMIKGTSIVAENMLKMGMSLKTISKATGLKVKKIKSLR